MSEEVIKEVTQEVEEVKENLTEEVVEAPKKKREKTRTNPYSAGDVIVLKKLPGVKFSDGRDIPPWAFSRTFIVTEVNEDLCTICTRKGNPPSGEVDFNYLIKLC